ncbi:MAG: hypothetical protein N3A02_05510 [Rectinema sp.]|nr:hypothetical protein [Rectinema sp.]
MIRTLENMVAFIITMAIVLFFCMIALPESAHQDNAVRFAIDMPRIDLTMHPKVKHGTDAKWVCDQLNEHGGHQFISWAIGQIMMCTDDPYEGDEKDVIGIAFFFIDVITGTALGGGIVALGYFLLTAFKAPKRYVRRNIEQNGYKYMGKYRR